MSKNIEFIDQKLKFGKNSWPIEDILGMEFNLDLGGKSKVTLSLKKPKTFNNIIRNSIIFLAKASLSYFSVILLAKYSILLSIILALSLLKLIIPRYWKIYKSCHSSGIVSFTFSDPIEFIKFQKSIWDNERGRKLIKSGFVLGKTCEQLFYVFLTPSIYNSEKFRMILKILVQVVYPIIVIIIPLFLGFCVMIGKNMKVIYKALRKDRFIKLVWEVAEEGYDFIEDVADDYKWSWKVWKFLDSVFDKIGDWLEIAFSWLRMEFLLVFMQIEYVNHCYITVWKSSINSFKFIGRGLKRLGFGWFVRSVEMGVTQFNKAIHIGEIRETLQTGENLKGEIDKVQDQLDKKNL